MTDSKTALAPPLRPASMFSSREFLRLILWSLAGVALVVAAIGPARVGANLLRMAKASVHVPDFGLLAAAPPTVRLHLAAVLIALAIGLALLIGVKGNRLHRALGWTWVLAMMTGAVSSLFIRAINHGSLSWIHLTSGWVIVVLPMAVAFARRHKVRAHARAMTGLFTGGLILAGLFAFSPGRLMWQVFFG